MVQIQSTESQQKEFLVIYCEFSEFVRTALATKDQILLQK